MHTHCKLSMDLAISMLLIKLFLFKKVIVRNLNEKIHNSSDWNEHVIVQI
jgi:hypothetical protein